MSYIKSPTKEEKAAYWKNLQAVSLFILLALAFVVFLFVLGYLFYRHLDAVIYVGLPLLMVVVLSGVVGSTYVEVYENWNMIYNRHRVGHYTYYMNSIFIAIFITVVSFGFYFALPLIGAPTPSPYLLSFMSIVLITVFTLYYIVKVKKDKPPLPSLTTEESEAREFLKAIYYRKLGLNSSLNGTEFLLLSDNFSRLGCLDYYINYGVFSLSQVEMWEEQLGNNDITVSTLFIQMDHLNKEHNKEKCKEVYEKASDLLSYWRELPPLMSYSKRFTSRIQRYLD
jgi:hypothetical protein